MTIQLGHCMVIINSINAGKSSIVMQETLRLINVVSLKVEDAGLYTCLASSLAGEDGKNHWVRVQGDTSCSCVLFNLAGIYHFPPLSELPLTCTWNMMNRSLRTLRSKDQGLRKVERLALAFSAYSHAKLLYCVHCYARNMTSLRFMMHCAASIIHLFFQLFMPE